MPVASSSRRAANHRRREPESDGIEEDEPSQRNGREAVDSGREDEEETRSRRRKVPKEERNRKADVQEGRDEDEDDDPLRDFGNQPLDKGAGQKLAGMSSDWSIIRRQTHNPHYAVVRDLASVFAEFAEGEKQEQVLAEMDTIMRDLLDTEVELLAHEKTLNELNQKVSSAEEIIDIVDRYEQEVRKKIDDYAKKTTRQKYAKAEEYAEFKQAIFEVQYPDTAMPPVTDFLPREEGDESDDDEDVVVGGVTQDYRCPLTLTILVNPMTSELCGHSFSGDAIKQYFSNNPNLRKNCPASGCNKMITLANLRLDKDLAKKAKDAARRERMRGDNSDAEEIVE